MTRLKITYRKSVIGQRADHRGTIRSLGLRKLGQSVVWEDSPTIRGQIQAVRHLITVEEVDDAAQ